MNVLLDAERAHLELLEKWRGAMNLIGPGAALHHFMDSRGAVGALSARGRWADLGSGAGFPGIALAIHNPEADVLLVESRERRANFLKQVVRAAGLGNAEVFHGRSEALSGPFDGIISRGYRSLTDYLLDADRLLAPSGEVVAMTGEAGLGDVPAGWAVVQAWSYALDDGQRSAHRLSRA